VSIITRSVNIVSGNTVNIVGVNIGSGNIVGGKNSNNIGNIVGVNIVSVIR